MSRAKELFGDNDYFSDYSRIVWSFGNVLVEVTDDDYQGDSRFILEKDGKYGFLYFGWGSCSGCDALQSCDNYEQVDELIDDLERGIVWKDSIKEIKEYVSTRLSETVGPYSYRKEEWYDFINKVNNL